MSDALHLTPRDRAIMQALVQKVRCSASDRLWITGGTGNWPTVAAV